MDGECIGGWGRERFSALSSRLRSVLYPLCGSGKVYDGGGSRSVVRNRGVIGASHENKRSLYVAGYVFCHLRSPTRGKQTRAFLWHRIQLVLLLAPTTKKHRNIAVLYLPAIKAILFYFILMRGHGHHAVPLVGLDWAGGTRAQRRTRTGTLCACVRSPSLFTAVELPD